MPNPVISIITPVYNTGAIMMETVESVLKQEPYQNTAVPDFEMIIVDDHSQDAETLALLEKLPTLDSRIKVIKNKRKKGVSGARNTGIDHAQGEWLAFLDSDDLLLPNALAYKYSYISKTPKANWIATPFYLLKPDIGIEKKTFSNKSPFLYHLIKKEFDQGIPSILQKPVEILCDRCILGVATVLVKKTIVLEINGFNENYKRHEDFDLWCRLATTHDLHHLPKDTAIYRIRLGGLTHKDDEPTFFGEEIILKGLLQDPLLRNNIIYLNRRLFDLHIKYCYLYRKNKKVYDSIKWSLIFIKNFPFSLKSWKMLVASIFLI